MSKDSGSGSKNNFLSCKNSLLGIESTVNNFADFYLMFRKYEIQEKSDT